MIRVGEFYDAVDSFAPFKSAESWDNTGLLIGGRDQAAERVLLALDLTGAVLEEAVRLGAGLVITHHPVIFSPLRSLDADSIPYKAAAAGIAVICAHTNLDIARGGVNDALANRLSLNNIRPLKLTAAKPYDKIAAFAPVHAAESVYRAMAEAGAGRDGNYSHCAFLTRGEGRFMPLAGACPAIGEVGRLERVEEIRVETMCDPSLTPAVIAAMKRAHPYESPAYDIMENKAWFSELSLGRTGDTARPMTAAELAAMVRERLSARGLRYRDGGCEITTVAVCGGSGGDLLRDAKKRGAQALVTGEAKHNHILEAAELGLTLIDAGHFATENVALEPLKTKLEQLIPGADIILSGICSDGMEYI